MSTDRRPTRLERIKANPLVQLATEGVMLAMIGATVVKLFDKVEDLRQFRLERELRGRPPVPFTVEDNGIKPDLPGSVPVPPLEFVDLEPTGEGSTALVPYVDRPLTPAELIAAAAGSPEFVAAGQDLFERLDLDAQAEIVAAGQQLMDQAADPHEEALVMGAAGVDLLTVEELTDTSGIGNDLDLEEHADLAAFRRVGGILNDLAGDDDGQG